MSSLRTYRRKIKTVQATQQITKAMKIIAATRLRRAQSRILSARPFAFKMRDLISDLVLRIAAKEKEEDFSLPSNSENLPPHPLLQCHRSNKIALVLVTADKGLCGSFNTNLIRKAAELLKENEGREISFFAVGRKGRDFFRRLGYRLEGEYLSIFNPVSYKHAEIIGEDLIKIFLNEKLSEVIVVYNEFKSVIQQNLVSERILPIVPAAGNISEHQIDFLYEPEKEKLLEGLLPRYVKSQLYRILLESNAAELGARMTAMDSATRNAGELIENLTLHLNRTRQAMITKEISEIVGGVEALK